MNELKLALVALAAESGLTWSECVKDCEIERRTLERRLEALTGDRGLIATLEPVCKAIGNIDPADVVTRAWLIYSRGERARGLPLLEMGDLDETTTENSTDR